MPDDNDIADNLISGSLISGSLISGSLKRSKSYHANYGDKTYKEIKELASGSPPDTACRWSG